MKKTIYIKSNTPALIEYSQEQILLENTHQYHSIEIEQDIMLKHYPISTNTNSILIPKLVKLKYDCTPNKDIKITEYDKNCYEVEIISTKISKLTQLEQKSININSNNYIVKLYSGNPSHITIVGEDCTFCHEVDFELNCLQVDNKNGYLVIQATNKDKTYLLILDNNFVIQEEKLFNILELNDQVLKGYLDQTDMAKHGSIISYDFTTKPYSTKQSSVYINNKPTITNNSLLIPFAFLEAVHIKNYKLAHHYLSTALSSKLNNQHLTSFFGDFVDIKQNIYTKTDFPIALVYGKDNVYNTKLFAFEIENNKIKNIIQA